MLQQRAGLMAGILLLLLAGYVGSYVALRNGIGSGVIPGSGVHRIIMVKSPYDRLIPLYGPCTSVETQITGRPVRMVTELLIRD